MLAGLVLVLARSMNVEAVSSVNGLSALKADAIEQGAVQYVLAHVDGLQGKMPTDDEMPAEAVQLGDGLFWIVKPNFENDREYAFGVVDEGSKLNLNTSSTSMLAMLPNVTDELTASLADWRNTDYSKGPSQNGAMSEYYLTLPDPYLCKNSPFETVEELFLVKGATTSAIFGEDTNRNGVLDPNEDDGSISDPPDNRDGKLDRGLYAYLTTWSLDPDLTVDGKPRTNVTGGPPVVRPGQTPPPSLNAVVKKYLGGSRQSEVLGFLNPTQPKPRPNFSGVLDFYVQAKLTPDEFAPMADQLSDGRNPRGRINVNTAPKEVLACLPGLEDADVQSLLTARTGASTDTTNLAWVAEALNKDRRKCAAIGPLITVRAYRFCADIVSVSGDGRAFRRCRVIVDATKTPPKVIYRQDLTRLGWPLSEDLLTKLRSGVSTDDIAAARKIRQEDTP